MILADKILSLRKKNGWSQEELAEKLNVSRQSISKWEGALAIPDINKIIEMGKLFGVTTDYLLNDEYEETIYNTDEEERVKKISLEQANEYINDSHSFSKKIGIGVILCILSPALLIYLSSLSEIKNTISEGLAVSIGIIALFVLVCLAICIFVLASSKMRKYETLLNDKFELEYGVTSIIKDKKEKYLPTFNLSVVIGILTIVLGVLPLIVTAILSENELLIVSMIILLLLFVCIGVYIFIRVGMKKECFDALLLEDDYKPANKESNKTNEKLSAVFWPLVTAGYLLWSFLANAWNISWIVWPIAGLVYAGIEALIKK